MSIKINGQFIAGTYKVDSIGQSSEASSGKIQLATQSEVNSGTNTTKAVTPATLNSNLNTRLESKQDNISVGDGISKSGNTISLDKNFSTVVKFKQW